MRLKNDIQNPKQRISQKNTSGLVSGGFGVLYIIYMQVRQYCIYMDFYEKPRMLQNIFTKSDINRINESVLSF